MVNELKLTNYYRSVLIDDVHHPELSQIDWKAQLDKDGQPVAIIQANDWTINLAHVIARKMGLEIGYLYVDHKDGDIFNAQENNLRLATPKQSAHNRKPHRDSRTGKKGVTFNRKENKYRAQIIVNRVHHHLGSYENIEDAERAFDKAAVEFQGEFAWLNFPDEHIYMKVKKLDKRVRKLPERVLNGAGLDIFPLEEGIIEAGKPKLIDTGIAIELIKFNSKKHYALIVHDKSGVATKGYVTKIAGVVDESYRGPVKIALFNFGEQDYHYDPSRAIAQIVIMPVILPEIVEVDSLNDSDRGERGFTSK